MGDNLSALGLLSTSLSKGQAEAAVGPTDSPFQRDAVARRPGLCHLAAKE
jgi:hypothetical protein